MDFLLEYGLFFAKAITGLVFILILISLISSLSQRNKRENEDGHIEVSRLHERFEDWQDTLNYALMNDEQYKKLRKERRKHEKAERKGKLKSDKKRLFVLDFDGDIRASEVECLRHEISAILTLATPQDEVLLRLESPGGLVHSYGLAASQLQRLRDKNIPLTIAIDRVAASGGYMMACIADRILAAPFAMLGSIGVVAQLPNFNRLLKKHDIDFEMLTAGEYKRTLTVFGENSDKAREKFQDDLENIHRLFKQFVARYRPSLDIETVATGEVWFGSEALLRGLADEIKTSDQYLCERVRQADVFEVQFEQRKRLQDRLSGGLAQAADRLLLTWVSRFNNQRFW